MSLGSILETRPLNIGTTIIVCKMVLNLGKLIGPKKFTYTNFSPLNVKEFSTNLKESFKVYFSIWTISSGKVLGLEQMYQNQVMN